jgi:hypothetical protein
MYNDLDQYSYNFNAPLYIMIDFSILTLNVMKQTKLSKRKLFINFIRDIDYI